MLECFAKVFTVIFFFFSIKAAYTCARLPLCHGLDEGQRLRRGRADVVHSALLEAPYGSALVGGHRSAVTSGAAGEKAT